MPADLRSAYLGMRRSGMDAFTPEGLEYLLHLILRASFAGKGFRELPAAELGRLFHLQAKDDFGSFAEDAMERFGFKTFGDLGRAVFLLAEQGCLTLRDGETRDEYAGLGPLRFA